MALQDLLNLSSHKKVGLSEERIAAIIPVARQYISFWREYPDMFVDFLLTGTDPNREHTFHFYFYQRCFLRAVFRYKYTYMVFARGYSKSFLAILSLILKCILYPRTKLSVSSGQKSQSADIVREKVEEICSLIPALERELDLRPGKTRRSKDYCIYVFKNGSFFDNLAARESTRGKRRHGLVLEECASMDGKILNEVLIPVTNISRPCMDGSLHPEEIVNKNQVYITTAGYKSTFAYQKLIQLLVRMIIEPDKAFIMGGTWRTPVVTGLQEKSTIDDMRKDDTFDEISFNREEESRWTGQVADAFFNGDIFDKNRTIRKPEYEASGRVGKNGTYYIVSVDVGRLRDQTAISVIKVNPQSMGPSQKVLVNMIILEKMHFENQAIMIKELYYKYKARRLVIDANGLGVGLMDFMVIQQADPQTGDIIPDFGVYNDAQGEYKKYQTPLCEQNAIYYIKGGGIINNEIHANMQSQLNSGKIKFLIDDKVAKAALLDTAMGKKMSPEARNEYLQPYVLTTILKMEMTNLRDIGDGAHIHLKEASKSLGSDKVLSLEYGLYYIQTEEEGRKKHKKFNAAEWKLYSSF